MSVVSIRFSNDSTYERLRTSARSQKVAVSALAERLIAEGLRSDAHLQVIFRPGPGGRRPVLIGGPEVADVVGAVVRGDVPVEDRRRRAGELLGIEEALVDAAIAYYADFTEEIDDLLEARRQAAEAAEAAWRRQQALLTR